MKFDEVNVIERTSSVAGGKRCVWVGHVIKIIIIIIYLDNKKAKSNIYKGIIHEGHKTLKFMN